MVKFNHLTESAYIIGPECLKREHIMYTSEHTSPPPVGGTGGGQRRSSKGPEAVDTDEVE